MNKMILMGRLTREPEVRQTANDSAVARFSIAVNRRFKTADGKEADFFNCVSFGRQAEFVEKYLHQGTKVLVTGHVQTGSFTNKDGNRVNTFDVITEEVEFAESKKDSTSAPQPATTQGYQQAAAMSQPAPAMMQQGYQQAAAMPQPAPAMMQQGYQQAPAPQQAPVGYADFMSVDEDDLPFG